MPVGMRFAVLALSGLSVTGCATMTRGTTQSFVVESSPPGASVETTNGFSCVATPCTFKMPRKEAFTATVSMPGYVTERHAVDSRMSGGGGAAMAGNILVGGIIGAGVDASSGALNDLTPNPLIVELEREGSASTAAPTTGGRP